MNHVIITADDFGLAEEVNEAVEIAHRTGVLSAASLMVGAAAARDAISRARSLPRLRTGLHIVVVDGTPVLSPEHIPDLVDCTGRLRRDLARLGLEIACRPSVRRQLRAEITAQFAAYQATGLSLDHVNLHKHFHLHPIVGLNVIAIGRHFGMRALRVLTEPQAILARIDRERKTLTIGIHHPWAVLLQASARRNGLLTPNAVFGLRWSGAFTARRMSQLIGNLGHGLVEIYTHPAIADEFPGHADGYRYSEEFEALRCSQTITALQNSCFRLGGYADVLESFVR